MRGAITTVLTMAFAGGCWTSASPLAPAGPADPDPPPAIRFALLDAGSLRVLAVVPGKPTLAIEREIAVADSAHGVVWAGPSAMAVTHWEEGTAVIELVGARGLVALPAVAWPDVAQPDGMIGGFESRAFTSDKQAQLVVANCAWREPDGFESHGECSTWQYARIWPPPVAVLDDAPAIDPARLPIPKITPGPVSAAVDEGTDSVRCTDAHGRVHELSPPEQGALHVDVLVADPPIFRFDTTSGSGFGPGYTTHRIYEGCARSRRYANAFAGPHGELVLVGHQIAVFWHGKLVARGPGRAPLAPSDEDKPDGGDESSRYDAEDQDGNERPLAVAFAPVILDR